MNPDHLDVDQPVLRTLLHELHAASRALEAALNGDGERDAHVREARAALEAFQTLERAPRPFPVPQRVRRRVEWALGEIEEGRLELADCDVRWAGSCFERVAFPGGRARRGH